MTLHLPFGHCSVLLISSSAASLQLKYVVCPKIKPKLTNMFHSVIDFSWESSKRPTRLLLEMTIFYLYLSHQGILTFFLLTLFKWRSLGFTKKKVKGVWLLNQFPYSLYCMILFCSFFIIKISCLLLLFNLRT